MSGVVEQVEMTSPPESDDDNMSVQESDDDDNDYQVSGQMII